MTIQAERLVLTVEEAAERLGIGRTMVYALVRSGGTAIPGVRRGSGTGGSSVVRIGSSPAQHGRP